MCPTCPGAPPMLLNIPVQLAPIAGDLLYVQLWRGHAVCVQLLFAPQPVGLSNNSPKRKTNEKYPASTSIGDAFQEKDALNAQRKSTYSGGFPGKWVCQFDCLLHRNMPGNLQFAVL